MMRLEPSFQASRLGWAAIAGMIVVHDVPAGAQCYYEVTAIYQGEPCGSFDSFTYPISINDHDHEESWFATWRAAECCAWHE